MTHVLFFTYKMTTEGMLGKDYALIHYKLVSQLSY